MRFGLLYILLLYSHFFLLLFFLSVFRFFSSFSLVYTVKKNIIFHIPVYILRKKRYLFVLIMEKKIPVYLGKKDFSE